MATITGTDASDFLVGTDDADIVNGGLGNDTIRGLGGNDTLNGAEGADDIDGGDGNDYLIGGAGNDTLQGGMNADTLEGGAGDDVLRGGKGFDSIDGGDGNDTIYSGLGQDTLTGGAGADVFVVRGSDPNFPGALKAPTITDFVAGTDTIAIQGATADEITTALTAQTTVDGGVSFEINGATVVVKGTGLTSLSANDVTTEDGIPENNPGQTFMLTTSQDNITGTSGNDTILGLNGTGATLTLGDVINGGAGTDTLKITSDNATVNMATATISNVENLEINQAAAGEQAATVVGVNNVAYTQVKISNVSGVQGGADTLAVNNIAASTKLVLEGLTDVATTVTYTGVAGSADAATIEIAGSAEDTNDGENDLTAAGIETLTLDFTTDDNLIATLTAANATTVNINVAADADTTLSEAAALGAATAVNINATGDLTLAATAALANDAVITVTGTGDVDLNTLDDNGADNGVTVAASALTGGLTVTGGANTVSITSGSGDDTVTAGAITTAVSLGAGNDTFNTNSLDFGGATAVNVDGGEGTDTINHDNGAEWDADFVAHVKNFEILDIGGGTGTYDANLIALEAVEVNADLSGAATITDLTDEAVRITATTTAALTLELDDATGSTDALSFTIEGAAVDTGADNDTSNDTNDLTVAEVVTAGIETVTVASNTAATNEAGANNTLSVIATDATKLVITGNHALEITDFQDDTSAGVNTDTVTIDASASAGLIMGDYVSGLNVSILGSEFADTILVGDDDGTGTGTATGSTVNAGAGGDVVTISVAGAVDTLIINAGDSKIGYTDTNADQAFTTAADAELYDIVTGFTTGEDTIDLGSFGFTGTKASALAGPSLTEAAAVDLVDGTTTSIASFFVDTGVQRGVAVVSGDFSDLGGTGTDTLVFIDSNGDGNLTNADDMIVLAGVATVSLADFGF